MNRNCFLFLLALLFVACKKDTPTTTATVYRPSVLPVVINIDQDKPGYTISPTFAGLSYETQLLTNTQEFLNVNNTVLINLFKNLGPGLLRIGGNTSDQVDWTGTERTDKTPDNSLTTSDIGRLAAFSQLSGWKVMFGLNLGNNNTDKALNEAVYVNEKLQSNLHSFQVGNEPDVYRIYYLRTPAYDFSSYHGEWTNYFTSVRSQVPRAMFTGPGIAYNTDWIKSFADKEAQNIGLIDGHYYNTGPATDSSITYHDILKKNVELPYLLSHLKAVADEHNLPFRITETNSVFGGGKKGVSNVFAASLWALDMMWQVAATNGEGVNFHGGQGLFYSPAALEFGVVKAKPVYYAMLAFKYGSTNGKILPVTISDKRNYNCTAYACANSDGSYSITIINKEETKSVLFNIPLTKAAAIAQVSRLSAPNLAADYGIQFAGSTVTSEGNFTPASTEQYKVENKAVTLTVPAGSAAVVTVR